MQVRDLNNIPREAELLRTALVAAHVDIELINMKDFPLGQKQTRAPQQFHHLLRA